MGSSGKKMNFSQTCSLLSQYLKEKGSFGEVGFGLARNLENKVSETRAPMKTMNLFPMIEKSGQDYSDPGKFPHRSDAREETWKKSDISLTKSGAESAPLTIFYAGQVIVFNDFPAEKANEIMSLASKSQNQRFPTYSPPNEQSPAESVASFPRFIPAFPDSSPLCSDLPIARKNSLARFLEKRKDRITANDPYPVRKPASPSANRAWAGRNLNQRN